MSNWKKALQSGKFLVSVELVPPKGVRVDGFLATLDALSGKVDAVTLPDGRSARIHLNSLAASLMAKEKGLEPIMTLSCRDRNRIALTADALGAYTMGIENLLCVSGDYFSFGDAEDAKPVFDLDSVQTIRMIKDLERGEDIGGNRLDESPTFCVGCVANPQASPPEPHLLKLEKKLSAGAEFVQTLDVYDLEKSKAFFEAAAGLDAIVLTGVRLVTEREIRLSEAGKLPGNPISRELADKITGVGDPDKALDAAREWVVDMIRRIKTSGACQGIHVIAEGNEDLIPGILAEAGI